MSIRSCLLTVFLAAVIGLHGQSSTEIPKESKGFLQVEAEQFATQSLTETRKWYTITAKKKAKGQKAWKNYWQEASGGSYIAILPDTRTNHSEKLIAGENFSNEPGKLAVVHYPIEITTPGRYYVWVKTYSTGSEDNGVHVGIDGKWPESGQRMQWCDGKNTWRWDNRQRTREVHCGIPGQIYLDIEKAGKHEIQFSMREDGFKMDQWIITTDKRYHPARVQQKEESEALSFMDKVKKHHPGSIILKATDFEIENKTFYKNGAWLAVNPNTHKKGMAKMVYQGPSGSYDMVMHGVGENDGRSMLSVQINDEKVMSFRPQLSTLTFEEGPDYGRSFSNLQLKEGDVIHVTGEIASRNGEFSRARWSGFTLTPVGNGNQLLQSMKAGIDDATVNISGELKKWHKVSLTFEGPWTSETADYNPFMNYRFNVSFTHTASGKSYLVPGYFAADGFAGNSSETEGNKWRVHFAPDELGTWTYAVDFRKGRFSAVSDKANTGVSAGFMDGASGTFEISATDKTGRDMRAKGRLQYVGERYLKFAETGEYFLKQGSDAPENFLAYADFDGTFHNDGHKDNLVKTWAPHLSDWKKGDPTWKDGKGKAMIGALNYLASEEMNAFSFLTNNIAGDDQNVFPYIDYDTYDRIDISKMNQWEMVFTHAERMGLFLHFKTLEVENQGLLDNGGVGANTKLYYRELMARFGHHLALNWNLGEENGEWIKDHPTPPQDSLQRLAMALYFKNHDPYHHHLVIHNGNPFDDLLGPMSGITGPSVQTHRPNFSLVHDHVLHWIEASEKAGKPWAVAVDEPGDAQHSLLPDAENPDHDMARKNALWGTLMAGGWGDEWYFGYKHAHSDLSCQDYRSRDLFWDQARFALQFFSKNKLPFWEMHNRNAWVGNPDNKNTVYCLAKENEVYVVYLNSVSTASLDLSHAKGTYDVSWYNPKTGGELMTGQIKEVSGGKKIDLGSAPDSGQGDWVILLRKR